MHKYGWEASFIAAMGVVIATLAIVTHVIPRRIQPIDIPPAISKLAAPQSRVNRATASSALPTEEGASRNRNRPTLTAERSSRHLDTHEVEIGPQSIRGRFVLLGVDRKQGTSASDELTLRLRVVSLAMADLVTPFQSTMLDVRIDGQDRIQPQHAFSHPVPARDHWDEDVVFTIPSGANLAHAALRIRYYPETREIPLDSPPRVSTR